MLFLCLPCSTKNRIIAPGEESELLPRQPASFADLPTLDRAKQPISWPVVLDALVVEHPLQCPGKKRKTTEESLGLRSGWAWWIKNVVSMASSYFSILNKTKTEPGLTGWCGCSHLHRRLNRTPQSRWGRRRRGGSIWQTPNAVLAILKALADEKPPKVRVADPKHEKTTSNSHQTETKQTKSWETRKNKPRTKCTKFIPNIIK